MSVREEDRKKNSCPSRGVAIAATALGVGLGAALYYLFNKRQETPNSEGSTSEWTDEPPPFHLTHSDDSYITISEHETTDTSILSQSEESFTSYESSDYATDDYSEDNDSDMEVDSDIPNSRESTMEMDELSLDDTTTSESETDLSAWETMSSRDFPFFDDRTGSLTAVFSISPIVKKDQQSRMSVVRQEAFRQRGWTLEECSICFDVMLRNQEITSLPCAHNFHTECILPWLQEKQTCPNCRKVAE